MKTPENWPADILQTSSQPAVSDKPIHAVSCRAQLTQAIDFPINFTKFSSWFCLVRITALVYRAVRIFLTSVKFSISYLTTAVPHSCRIHLRKDQTSTVNHKRQVFSRNFPPSSLNNHCQPTAASKHYRPTSVRMDSSVLMVAWRSLNMTMTQNAQSY